MRKGIEIRVGEQERKELEAMVRAGTSPQRMVYRARIVLELAQGYTNTEVAKRLKTSQLAVGRWRKRFVLGGIKGLEDAAGRGRKSRLDPQAVGKVLSEAGRKAPDGGRWTCRRMAKAVGIGKSAVHELWKSAGIKPHLERGFKLSHDPDFEKKYWDVVGLYINPPEHAVVLCCDEKSQCQALERSQPGLPLKMGHICTRTHDYYRHGTITLFAALDYLSGKVIASTEEKHRHQEWIKFLKDIDKQIDADKDIHIICDNYSTHKHVRVKNWLKRHPRFHVHFTPTGSSWLNMVERFFGDITRRIIRPGNFPSLAALVGDITKWIHAHNLAPKRYVWRAAPQQVLEKIHKAWEVYLETIYNPI